ncbi:MAG: hypothetical protein VYD70_06070 [Planctomycetota bacterium]|nr:hypothetical protein [Planctomycetota bacterium]MEE2883275.1 hypothetical protein [Planctomycetota bacterium]
MVSPRNWLPIMILFTFAHWGSLPVFSQTEPVSTSPAAERVWEIIQSHDDDGDGVVTRDEFDRDSRSFNGYDLNGDGRLTRDEIQEWVSTRSRGRGGRGGAGRSGAGRGGAGTNRGRGPARMIGALGDTNADGIVTRVEWGAALQAMTEDGKISVETFRTRLEEKGLGRMVQFLLGRIDPDGSGFISIEAVEMMFVRADADGDGTVEVTIGSGDANRPENPGTGSSREGAGVAREPQARGSQRSGPAPAVGNRAPDFTLPLATDPKQLIQLSGFAGKKPVALIFGSYT